MNDILYFLSCDWGTSAFRLRLVEVPSLKVVGEVSNHNGCAAVFNQWKSAGANQSGRVAFYQNFIVEGVQQLQQQTSMPCTNLPLIMSGMASSTLGLMELPYKHLPFNIDGSDLLMHQVPATDTFPYNTTLVSGVRTDDDVMRGEEVQLIGCNYTCDDALFIMPGTHSKHIKVANGKAVNFSTYMTGEMFSLLSAKSILANSVEDAPLSNENLDSFKQGVCAGRNANILKAIFAVRTNVLFNKLSAQQNYHYLSGLLIGHELAYLQNISANIVLVAGNIFQKLYNEALNTLGITNFTSRDADDALVKGHCRISMVNNKL